MASVSTLALYVNPLTKLLVSVNGSPTTVPAQYYGDIVSVFIYPVVPTTSNPAQGFTQFNLTGYTMDLTMAGTPNATSPPTPFAQLAGLTWTAPVAPNVYGYFSGLLNLTNSNVGAFIGTAAQATAYFNLDVFDVSLNRTTIYQNTFSIAASIDSATFVPGPPGSTTLTLQQALALFVQVGPIPGKQIIFQSPDTLTKKQLTIGNDGAEQWNTVNVP